MIYLRVLIVFSSLQLTPPSLSAHLNNYYNPEECKLRGTNNGGKGKTLKKLICIFLPAAFKHLFFDPIHHFVIQTTNHYYIAIALQQCHEHI